MSINTMILISKNFDFKRKNNVINLKFILYNENKSIQIEKNSQSDRAFMKFEHVQNIKFKNSTKYNIIYQYHYVI